MRWRHLLILPLAMLMAYGLGFVWYLRLTSDAPDLPARADAIVVLTGGPARIETGVRLLVSGHAPMLLVSGLGGGATEQDLARRAGVDHAVLTGRVTLGRSATSTRTNALETARFAARHDIRDLILVTAGYHMPRAMVELGRALPGVRLHPAPVPPGRGMARMPSWRLLVEEYSKWLIAAAGLSGFGPTHAPWPGPPGRGGAGMHRNGPAG